MLTHFFLFLVARCIDRGHRPSKEYFGTNAIVRYQTSDDRHPRSSERSFTQFGNYLAAATELTTYRPLSLRLTNCRSRWLFAVAAAEAR